MQSKLSPVIIAMIEGRLQMRKTFLSGDKDVSLMKASKRNAWMKKHLRLKSYIVLLICLNIFLQIAAFCLMKLSWMYAQHSIIRIINYVTMLAFSASFLRAFIWQHILKVNDLVSSYLPNAIVPSLLLVSGCFIFHEKVTIYNIIGSLIILSGLVMLFKSTARQ